MTPLESKGMGVSNRAFHQQAPFTFLNVKFLWCITYLHANWMNSHKVDPGIKQVTNHEVKHQTEVPLATFQSQPSLKGNHYK